MGENFENSGNEIMSRREFNKYLWIYFSSAVLAIIFGRKAEAQAKLTAKENNENPKS